MCEDNPKTYELLGELCKLLKKYGKDTLLDLAMALRNPDLTAQLAEVLESVPMLTAPKKLTKKRLTIKQEQAQFLKSLATFSETEPEKASILTALFSAIRAKTILPTLRALTAFIADHGLPVPRVKSREKVALSFLRQCTGLSLVDLRDLADKATLNQLPKDGDRSLAGWGRIILDRKKEED